ncbi:MAG TPA: zinc ribbon domain-containing protein [Acetobacteraceae bacterium]|nr:zinc ribbon domain-containing protein [Acetobacteraceae bacterium]
MTRAAAMRRMDAAAGRGLLALQRCADCGRVQYPPREVCAACLGDALEWEEAASAEADLLAETTLHHSHDPAFAEALPLRVGLARLAAGAVAITFLDADCTPGCRARVSARLDAAGRAILHASPTR